MNLPFRINRYGKLSEWNDEPFILNYDFSFISIWQDELKTEDVLDETTIIHQFTWEDAGEN